jgi:hypothetical protein
MKKILVLGLVMLFIFSCNKDDNETNEETQVEKTWANVLGNWKLIKLKRPDGTIDDYTPQCPSKIAVLLFKNPFPETSFYRSSVDYYDQSCLQNIDFGDSSNPLSSQSVFANSLVSLIESAKIVSLTQNTMEVIITNGSRANDAYQGLATAYYFVRLP